MDKKTITVMIFGFIMFSIFVGAIIFCCAEYASYGSKVGTVIDKQYTSESSYYTYDTQYINNSSIKIPKYHYEPEHWKLKIQKTENEKTKSIWIDVPKEEYNNIKIGEYYGE